MSFEVGDNVVVTKSNRMFDVGEQGKVVEKYSGELYRIDTTKKDGWICGYRLDAVAEPLPETDWVKSFPISWPDPENNAVLGKATKYPNNNPKAAVGAKKLPIHQVPPALMIGAAEAMADGAEKYGPYNFRESQIAASVYMGAMLRHLFAWWDGEDNAEDSGVHHMKHVAACAGLILDSMACGTFDDDRPPASGAAEMIKGYKK